MYNYLALGPREPVPNEPGEERFPNRLGSPEGPRLGMRFGGHGLGGEKVLSHEVLESETQPTLSESAAEDGCV